MPKQPPLYGHQRTYDHSIYVAESNKMGLDFTLKYNHYNIIIKSLKEQ